MDNKDGNPPRSESTQDFKASDASRPGDVLDRRELLQYGLSAAAGLIGLNVASSLAYAAPRKPMNDRSRVRRYVSLGNTGLKISDVSIGTGALGNPALIHYAIERGINYIDTADGYPMIKPGLAEKAIGRAIAGRRKNLVLATKTNTTANVRKQKLMSNLNASLRRLGTDYIDIYFNQAVNDTERLLNPEWFEFVDLAKKQGKIRFSGMSGHGGRLVECLDIALERELFDVILTAYNFGQDPAFYEKLTRNFDLIANQKELPRVLEKAHKMGVGVMVMKTLMGAKLNDMRPYEKPGHTFPQAAFRWVLSNSNVDGLIVTMKSKEQIDEYLVASGSRAVSASDLQILERYARLNDRSHCRFGCSTCESSCPEGVQISDVLRSRMYAEDYGDLELGRASYASIAQNAQACSTCSHQRCLGSCPYGLSISELTKSADALLRNT